MTIALIDGDIIVHGACKSRWESKVKLIKLDEEDTHMVQLDSAGNKVQPEYTEEEDREYLKECWKNVQLQLKDILESTFCTEYLIAVKGEGNYRLDLYPKYKFNRHKDPKLMNKFVPNLRKLLAMEDDFTVEAHDMEADDLICMWAQQCRDRNIPHIVCSIDKDLRCIPGKHFIMSHHGKPSRFLDVTEEEALRFYYKQLIVGDATDFIPGVPLIGPKKADKALESCTTEEEMQIVVVEKYLYYYGPDEWYNYFISNAKMIHLKRTPTDYFDCQHWPIIKELL